MAIDAEFCFEINNTKYHIIMQRDMIFYYLLYCALLFVCGPSSFYVQGVQFICTRNEKVLHFISSNCVASGLSNTIEYTLFIFIFSFIFIFYFVNGCVNYTQTLSTTTLHLYFVTLYTYLTSRPKAFSLGRNNLT